MTARQRAFARPAPRGWQPKPLESVWLASEGTGKVVAKAVATVCAKGTALVLIRYGHYVIEECWPINLLRPRSR